MSFSQAAQDYLAEAPARTANGMKARATTASKVLDFFGQVGSSRGTDISRQFAAAVSEDRDLAIRALLWTRDVRGGAGERQQFRNLLRWIEERSPTLAGSLMFKVPELGRWDDLFTYQDPINRAAAFDMIGAALANKDGLAAKWMPRKGNNAVALRTHLGMSPKQYRKTLVNLTNVVETAMCAKDWDGINFSHVPSLASARYQKAFGRNASDAYAKYIAELQKPQAERDPKVKINAGAVYPYDVVKSVAKGNAAVADEQWKALPNFVGDAKIMPMVDVSGSMGSIGGGGYGHRGNGPSPIEVAVSLGLYLSEKNTSDFKDLFLTFSGSPKLVHLKGSLSTRISQMTRSDWEFDTNLHRAFDELLKVAKRGNVRQEDMPQYLVVLSDMQFNSCTQFDDSAQQMIARKYRDAGYEVPRIIFWNLSMYGSDNTPVRFDDRGVCHVSGFSPSLMETVLSAELDDYTPYNVMVKKLMSSRYDY